jgi:hypothetical protein
MSSSGQNQTFQNRQTGRQAWMLRYERVLVNPAPRRSEAEKEIADRRFPAECAIKQP